MTVVSSKTEEPQEEGGIDTEQMCKQVEHLESWECRHCGACCRSFTVCVTHFDLINLFRYRPDLSAPERFDEFLEFVIPTNDCVESFEGTPRFRDVEEDCMLTYKADDETGECVFHADSGCTIYPVRPLTCRFFPFEYNGEPEPGEQLLTINEVDRETCSGFGTGSPERAVRGMIQAAVVCEQFDEEFSGLVDVWNALYDADLVDDTLEDLVEFLVMPLGRLVAYLQRQGEDGEEE